MTPYPTPPGIQSQPSFPLSKTVKNTAAYRARLYQFSLIPGSGRGNNSEKCRNSPGTIQGIPAGIPEVIYSNVTTASAKGNRASAKPCGPGGCARKTDLKKEIMGSLFPRALPITYARVTE